MPGFHSPYEPKSLSTAHTSSGVPWISVSERISFLKPIAFLLLRDLMANVVSQTLG